MSDLFGSGSAMFLGTYTPRLDDKGRLILPAKFRDELAGGVVITQGQDRCLYVFPTPEFQRIAEQLRGNGMNVTVQVVDSPALNEKNWSSGWIGRRQLAHSKSCGRNPRWSSRRRA